MGNNPHWDEFLKDVPEPLHGPVIAAFTKWDEAYRTKVAETNQQFAPVQQLLNQGLSLEDVVESVNFAQFFQQNPQAVIENANKEWDLGYTKADALNQQTQQQQQMDDPDELELGDGMNMEQLMNHPVFKQMAEQLNTLSQKETQRENESAEQQAIREHEEYLDALEKQPDIGPFNRDIVTAFMTRGLDGPAAVNAYKEELAKMIAANGTDQTQQTPAPPGTPAPPPVMDGSNSGSGLSQEIPKFGELSSSAMVDMVAKMAAASQNNSQT